MPLALDPEAKADYTLKTDKGKPGAPVFHLRFLTARQRREQAERLDRLVTATDGIEQAIDEALAFALKGWAGLPSQFPSIDRTKPLSDQAKTLAAVLDDMLMYPEKAEIAFSSLNATSITDTDQKN